VAHADQRRVGGVRASPENATRLLRHGELVCVFPEGVKGLGKLYKNRYRLQRFGRGGFVKICLDTRSPLVPVAVVGAEEIHPMIARGTWLAAPLGIPYIPITPVFPWLGLLGLIPLPSKWMIRFGEPIEFQSFSDGDRKNRILVNKLSQQVRKQIQEMIIEQLKERRSVWWG
jgi:1-acyl-sn-glycerol-3-phosphate acyltransferase